MECPQCGTQMESEDLEEDCFSHTTGHYTRSRPSWVCPNTECENVIDKRETEPDPEPEI